MRLIRISENLSNIGKIAIGINFSFVLVGLATLIIYYIQGSIKLLPWFFLIILITLGYIYWFKINGELLILRLKISKWNLLFVTGIIMSILISFFVNVAQRYILPGDLWVSLNPAVHIISQNTESFKGSYPIIFGFILAGLSVCSGIPVVNTYVLLFPLISLNALSFFVLLKIIFNMDDRISSVGSILYTLTGGFGWLIQTLIYHGTLSFWSISLLTHDMYWSLYFRNNIYFSHKLLALTLAFVSLVAFKQSLEFKDTWKSIITLILSSLLLTFSFFIHMIELIIFAPLMGVITLMHKRGKIRYINFAVLTLITVLVFYTIDFLTHGWYSCLTILQIELKNLKSLSIIYCLMFGVIIILVSRFLYRQSHKYYIRIGVFASKFKVIIVVCLMGIYLSSLIFLKPTSYLGYLPFPWYCYAARYGFIGILAIIGIGVSSWKERWFIIASIWCLIAIFVGMIWWEWGSRFNAYQFPMLALFAAVGIDKILDKARARARTKISIYINNSTHTNPSGRIFRFDLKTIIATFIIAILVLSSTSLVYGISFYISQRENVWLHGPSLTDDQVRSIAWINQNTPENITVLVPDIFRIYRGLEGISNRETYLSDGLPATIGAELIEILNNHNIRYVLTVEDEYETSQVLRLLLSYSTLVFQSGDVKVFRLAFFSSPL